MRKTILNCLKVVFWTAVVVFALVYGDFSCASSYGDEGSDRPRYNPTTRMDY
jgi:hypothetical protein